MTVLLLKLYKIFLNNARVKNNKNHEEQIKIFVKNNDFEKQKFKKIC
jgi:hypothetical protein